MIEQKNNKRVKGVKGKEQISKFRGSETGKPVAKALQGGEYKKRNIKTE